MQWTKEQLQVILLRDRNLLVSAAAGSGKTAVLVERIIGRILEQEHPVDIDRMLIVTFTKAAAAEMRERIMGAIEAELEKDPGNGHLSRQATLLHHAQITTIHSFCLYLIRSYFHRIDLEPDFRIAEEGELNLLREDVMADVLNRNYEEQSSRFLQFVECFAVGKKDDVLRDMILKVYDFAMSYPWPKEWLKEMAENYRIEDGRKLQKKPWMQSLMGYLRSICANLLEMAEENHALTMEIDGPLHAAEIAEHDARKIKRLAEAETYRQMSELLLDFRFDRLPSKRGYDGDVKKLDCFKEQREEMKSIIKKLKETYFFAGEEEQARRLLAMEPAASELMRLAEEFMDAFDDRKREKNILDFNDLEHFALKILLDEKTKEPTEAAIQCQSLFEEVMVDEYQDSNFVQETLLWAVSKEHAGGCNRFMVGDVKQSIYRFRLARPALFMEKYDAYTVEDSKNQKIELHKNFRSRMEVIDFVNDIFYGIMKKDLGNVAYDKASALYPGAVYPEAPGMEAELIAADPKAERMEEANLTDPIRLEAELIAGRIQKLMRDQKVTDAKTGTLREIRYQDIVILLRSFGKYADAILEALEQKKIPAHATSRTGYFKALEIQTLLAFLKILDNPRQDIPLAAVLASPIGGFSAEELACIKGAGKERSFHSCVLEPESKQLLPELDKKLQSFLWKLSKYRDLVAELPIHELLYRVLEETGYGRYAAAMPGGRRRKANIDMLLEKAASFEQTSYRGLFHFIRYMEKLQKYEVDYGEADIAGENANVIRIMTIHKSKGLEFPVVFLCGTAKQFNRMDARGSMAIHPEFGVAMDYLDPILRVRSATIYKKAVAKQIELENQGEELRVLYVALTRAKEKLIVTGVEKGICETLEKQKMAYGNSKEISFLKREKAGSYLSWILPAMIRAHREACIQIWGVEELVKEEAESRIEEAESLCALQQQIASRDEEADAFVEEQLSYQYPKKIETARKVKYSVSELKHRAAEAVLEESEHLEKDISKGDPADIIPRFAGGKTEGFLGALRGVAMHRAMECLPVWILAGSKNLKEELEAWLEKLEAGGRLEKEMRSLLQKDKLIRFYQSDLAMRMKQAFWNHALYVERPFVMGKRADEIEGDGSDTMVLVQGIIDAFFVEEGEIVLLDYKTDVVKSEEELKKRYQKQLELYQEAIERNFGKKVKEKILYSFYLNHAIAL